MTTNFFTAFLESGIKGTIHIGIQATADNIMTISVYTVPVGNKQEAAAIPPLVFANRTARELDEAFYRDLMAPVKKARAALDNLDAYNSAVENAGKLPEKKKSDKTATESEKLPAKFVAAMEKAEAMAKNGKYGQALYALPKTADFPAQADLIKAKINEYKSKRTDLAGLFGEQTTSSAGPDREQRATSPAPQIPTSEPTQPIHQSPSDLSEGDEDDDDDQEEEDMDDLDYRTAIDDQDDDDDPDTFDNH